MAFKKGPPIILRRTAGPAATDAERIHQCFNRITLRDHPWPGPRIGLLLEIALWPVTAWSLARKATRKHGASIGLRTGKTAIRQRLEAWWLAIRFSIPPKNYYIFQLFEPERREQADLFLHRFETKPEPGVRDGIYRVLNRALGGSTDALSDKHELSERCREIDVPCIPSIAVLRAANRTEGGAPIGSLPEIDLITKPARGSGGKQIRRFDFLETETYLEAESGTEFKASEILEYLNRESREADWLVQPRLFNHEKLQDLGGGALTTARIQTALDERGNPEVVGASFRVPVHEVVVDNLHRGGLACQVHLENGVLGRGILLRGGANWTSLHPVSGAQIEGRKLPDWADAKELTQNAHAAFPEAIFVAWDVAFTPDGPVLVEANVQGDVNLLQRCSDRPLGATRFGELMARQLDRIDTLPPSLEPRTR